MSLSRRAALGLIGAAPLAAGGWARAAGSRDAALLAALDRAVGADPGERLELLAGFDPATLSLRRALDLEVVRAEARVAHLMQLIRVDARGRFALELERQLGAPIPVATAKAWLTRVIHRLRARADTLFDQLGVAGQGTGDRFLRLADDPAQHYADSDSGRAQAVADMNGWLAVARAHLPGWFETLPSECGNVSVRALTVDEIAAGIGGYRILPTIRMAGGYIVDLKDIARRPRFTLRSVLYHETLPGHLVQLPVEARAAPHPLRIEAAGAFIEAWATYAEGLAVESGVFADDPAGELGAIHWLLFRAWRGLADVMIHGEGAAAGDVLPLIRADMGFPVYFASFEKDLGQIADHPGTRAAEALLGLCLIAPVARTPPLRRALIAPGRRSAATLRIR